MEKLLIVLLVTVSFASQPLINGFFIQPSLGYGVVGWNRDGETVFDSQDAYDNWIKSMADIGAEMLFYQWSVHYWENQDWFAKAYNTPSSADFAFYDIAANTIESIPTQSWISPTPWPGSKVEPVQRALDACEKSGVELWLGLYLNEAGSSFNWWDAVSNTEISANDSVIIQYHIDRTNSLVDELYERFGNHSAFGGFYYPVEIANVAFIPEANWPYLAYLLDEVADQVHEIDPDLELSISPFFNTAGALEGNSMGTPEEYGDMWDYALEHSDLDILILQDGAGVEPNILTDSQDLITPYYEAARIACEKNGIRFWANCELFTNHGDRINPKFVPSSIENVKRQLETESIQAEKTVSFSFQYMDPNPKHQFPSGTYTSDSIVGGEVAQRIRLYSEYEAYRDSIQGETPTSIQETAQFPVKYSIDISNQQLSIQTNEAIEISLFSVSGKIMIDQQLQPGNSLPLETVPNGVYFVSIKHNRLLQFQRIIVQ